MLAIACHTFIYSFKATSGISKLASGLTQGLDPPSAGRSTFPGVFPDTRSTLSITTAFSTKRIHPAVDCRMRPLEIPWKKIFKAIVSSQEFHIVCLQRLVAVSHSPNSYFVGGALWSPSLPSGSLLISITMWSIKRHMGKIYTEAYLRNIEPSL